MGTRFAASKGWPEALTCLPGQLRPCVATPRDTTARTTIQGWERRALLSPVIEGGWPRSRSPKSAHSSRSRRVGGRLATSATGCELKDRHAWLRDQAVNAG